MGDRRSEVFESGFDGSLMAWLQSNQTLIIRRCIVFMRHHRAACLVARFGSQFKRVSRLHGGALVRVPLICRGVPPDLRSVTPELSRELQHLHGIDSVPVCCWRARWCIVSPGLAMPAVRRSKPERLACITYRASPETHSPIMLRRASFPVSCWSGHTRKARNNAARPNRARARAGRRPTPTPTPRGF